MKKVWFLFLGIVFGTSLWAQYDPEFGLAGVYANEFAGRKMSNGGFYQPKEYTVAHNSLPFGTIVLIRNLENNKSARSVVTDRGPFVEGNILELSRATAQALDISPESRVKVKMEVVRLPNDAISNNSGNQQEERNTPPSSAARDISQITEEELTPDKIGLPEKVKKEIRNEEAETKAESKSKDNRSAPRTEKEQTVNAAVKSRPKEYDEIPEESARSVAQKEENKANRAELPMVQSRNYQDFNLYKIQLLRPEKKGFGVQVASLTNYRNVLKQVAELQDHWFENILISVEPGTLNQPVYKIILGPFEDRATASAYEKSLKKKHQLNGFVIDLSTIQYD